MTGERRGSVCVSVKGVSPFLTFPSLVLQPELYIWSSSIFPLLFFLFISISVFCFHTVSRAPPPASKSSVGSPRWPNWSSASRAWPQGCRALRAPWGPPWCWRRATHVWSLRSTCQSRHANCWLPTTRSVTQMRMVACINLLQPLFSLFVCIVEFKRITTIFSSK